MKRAYLALIIAGLVVAASAHAGDLIVTWTAPTQCTDNSPISNCPVTGYNLFTAQCSASAPLTSPLPGAPTVTVGANVSSFDFANTPANTTWCATVQAVSASGNSVQSNVATGTVTVAPGAPAIQNVSSALKTTGTAVYLATMIPNGWSFLQVGTVPVGTPCMAGHGIEGYNVVLQGPAVTVTWSGSLQPLTIVALCQ